MLRRRKRGLRSRQKAFLLVFVIIIIMCIAAPFVWRMERLRQAKSVYDIQKVEKELLWLEKNAGFFNNLEVIKDTKLWLDLNVGNKDLESKLALYQDDKHRFWLSLFYLQEGKLLRGQSALDKIRDPSLKSLAKGLMSIADGDAMQSRYWLTETETNWGALSIQEQTIRRLTLAKAALMIGDYQSAQIELNAAQKLDQNNPACLSLAFDIAIEEGQWKKAVEASQLIDAQTWRPKNALYETKKAILAIHEDNMIGLSHSLASLKELPKGDVCIDYIKGIQTIDQGKLKEGKNLLERALKNELEGELKGDAQKALSQIVERLKADQSLRSVVAETS